MGADNWRVCPKCIAAKQAKYKNADKRHKALYGKVSLEDYNAQAKVVADLKKSLDKHEETLAEYVDIRISKEGLFSVDYSAGCREPGCDFEYRYEHQEQLATS